MWSETKMSKRLSITFTQTGTTVIADLLERQAPKTCAALWRAFERPAVNQAIHAMYAGRELIFGLPAQNQNPEAASLPPENQIIIPVPGDICFRFYAPNELNNPGAGNEHEVGFFDLMIFYGRNARLFSSQGWVPSNLFAQVTENLDGLAEMGRRIHREGVKELRIERVA
jgi:hypothetical protein